MHIYILWANIHIQYFLGVCLLCVQLNAMANRAAGKGYENEDHYTNIKLQFIGIENIHVMRSSQQKVIDGVCECPEQII